MAITAVGTQAGGNSGDSSATVERAFGSNVAVGNLIVVMGCKSDLGSAFAAGDCTKSAGTATIGAITLDVSLSVDLLGGIGARRMGIWSAIVTGAGSCTMRLTGAAATYWVLGTMELHSDAGGFDASRVEATNTGSNTTDNTLSALSGNATSAGAAIFCGAVVSESTVSGAVAFTPDAAFTQVFEQEDGSVHLVGSTIYRIVASGTTDSADWTVGTSNAGYVAGVAVFKEAGVAAANNQLAWIKA